MRELSAKLDGYTIGKRIGRGARSVICEIHREEDEAVFASKCVRLRGEKDQKVLRHLQNENRVLKDLHSVEDVPPQIVRREEFVRMRKFFRLVGACLILERISGPDLLRYCEYSVSEKINIVEQVCEALAFVHDQGYIHGDLKPDNILVEEGGRAKLIDFGFAAPIGSDVEGMKGTWGFMAPEQVGGTLTPDTDVYNLGAAMYWLFTGQNLPYLIPEGRTKSGLSGEVSPTPPHQCTPNLPRRLSDLIMRCCNSEAVVRPTVTQLHNKLHDIRLHLRLSV